MRVLASAYACEPGRGSEPGAGWAWVRAAAEEHEVWLLTRANNGPAIEAALAEDPAPIHPVYVELPAWARFWKRGRRGIWPYYVLWQLAALRAARRIVRAEDIDVAHHVTLATDWLPTPLVRLGVPVVWGPVGGSTTVPPQLRRWLGRRGAATEIVRAGASACLRRVSRLLFARPTVVVAQNGATPVAPDVVEPNVALDPSALPQRALPPSERLAVFVGRLLPWKGLTLAIAALAEPDLAEWRLDVYGAGHDLGRARRLAAELGLDDRVQFLGRRPRHEVLDAVAGATAVVAPAMREAAGWAVAEALTIGTPVVCLAYGGPQVLLARAGREGVPVTADEPRRELARALANVQESAPSTAWTAARLPAVVTSWYEMAARTRRVSESSAHGADSAA